MGVRRPDIHWPTWNDYELFHKLSLKTWDVDPSWVIYRRLADDLILDAQDTAWLCMLHTIYYHYGSVLTAFALHPHPRDVAKLPKLPTGKNRRGHNDPVQLQRHTHALADAWLSYGGLLAWLEARLDPDPRVAWKRLQGALELIEGNGRWAVFTALGLLNAVMGWQLEATDMMHAHSTGPRDGLSLLYPRVPSGNTPEDIAVLDRWSRWICARLDSTPDIVETTLCDLWTLANGRYYVGHDIDVALKQGGRAGPLRPEFYAARAAVLPHEYLGELNGWSGVDPERRLVYLRTGQLVER